MTLPVHHMTERVVTLDIHYAGTASASSKRIKNVLPGDPWNAYDWDV